ncbi:hypothetical protein BGW80DRAFT_1309879 [Lactifluus volemus]|nr:hypothetical protein BGW80DRAFT_1309879 [Lactifluus volemus]
MKPRNIVRTHGGGFLLIDFSESRKHDCKESKVEHLALSVAIGRRTPRSGSRYELQTLRKLLWKRHPLQAKGADFG